MDERKAFEAWQGSRKPSYPAEWEAWQTAWQAATLAERERAAKAARASMTSRRSLLDVSAADVVRKS